MRSCAADPAAASKAASADAIAYSGQSCRAGNALFRREAATVFGQEEELAALAAMPEAHNRQAGELEAALRSALRGAAEGAAEADGAAEGLAEAAVEAEGAADAFGRWSRAVATLRPYVLACAWHYAIKPHETECDWWAVANKAAMNAASAEAAAAAAVATAGEVKGRQSAERTKLRAANVHAKAAEAALGKEAEEAAAAAEVAEAAVKEDDPTSRKAAAAARELADAAAAKKEAASASVWRMADAKAKFFASPAWTDEMVVDAATIVLEAMRARLPFTASTSGHDSCMKLQWIRKLLLAWVRTMDRFDESLLDDRAFLRLVRTTAYACLAFREAAALICTGRLTLWIRARQQVFPGDNREGVAVHAVLGAKTASLWEVLKFSGLCSSQCFGTVLEVASALERAAGEYGPAMASKLLLAASESPHICTGYEMYFDH
ncbi:hypothetical protein EMIHUDRAFT_422484 [Emiliania huxleyi CCMP1516]|uniref:Uncharacterized protein n=2 Tax=Emiliania huxleyi TaxID=2903 RepID=A0A0D3IAS9_EMIH1|nr:hypothetical protein EMIHUDRAFT_422484 [Emiliania huxleyi CCMP1516]EOD08364.1 hypothetical protein EMIHUDRAFT_422484 [Emiliania huxleyi CCMP1516]|eukprot:XP_005760793.1 hypothetical protein EMIHUDRAFT_422484 [Emiliania huxleyi CCMP1516]